MVTVVWTPPDVQGLLGVMTERRGRRFIPGYLRDHSLRTLMDFVCAASQVLLRTRSLDNHSGLEGYGLTYLPSHVVVLAQSLAYPPLLTVNRSCVHPYAGLTHVPMKNRPNLWRGRRACRIRLRIVEQIVCSLDQVLMQRVHLLWLQSVSERGHTERSESAL